jgi:hypothetical protein
MEPIHPGMCSWYSSKCFLNYVYDVLLTCFCLCLQTWRWLDSNAFCSGNYILIPAHLSFSSILYCSTATFRPPAQWLGTVLCAIQNGWMCSILYCSTATFRPPGETQPSDSGTVLCAIQNGWMCSILYCSTATFRPPGETCPVCYSKWMNVFSFAPGPRKPSKCKKQLHSPDQCPMCFQQVSFWPYWWSDWFI